MRGKTATPRMRTRRGMGRSMRAAVGQRRREAGRTRKEAAAVEVIVTMSGTKETGRTRRQRQAVGRKAQERGQKR